MKLFAHISSLLTLLSLFILGPALGRALLLWWDGQRKRTLPSQHIALGISTMIAMAALLIFYGTVWKANPRLVAWYSWIDTELPISGDVEVTGGPSKSKWIVEPLVSIKENKGAARRIAADIAKLPKLLTRYFWTAWWVVCSTGASSSDGIGS